MGEVVRPEGDELRWYVKNEYAICNQCGVLLEARGKVLDPEMMLVCPGCGWEGKSLDYRYEGETFDDEDEEEEDFALDWAPGMDIDDDLSVPPGCAACGGPYPYCTTSCKIFDD